MKLTKLAAGLGLALSLTMAQAAVLSFEDDDIDFALTSDLTLRTSGTLGVGDVLVSVFEIPQFTIAGANGIPAGQELTGVAAVQITSIVGTSITFSAYSGGLNSILALGAGPAVTNGGAGEGATIAMFLNSTADFDLDVNRTTNPASNCLSLAHCIDVASDGSLFQVDGFAGDPDEYWQAVAFSALGLDIGLVHATGNATLVAAFNAAQTTFFNATGDIAPQHVLTGALCPPGGPGPDSCVSGLVLSGTITGGVGLSNGAFAHSDFDGIKLQVPEPGSLALAGLALLGLGLTGRQRRR